MVFADFGIFIDLWQSILCHVYIIYRSFYAGLLVAAFTSN